MPFYYVEYIFYIKNTHCIYQEKETTLNSPVLRRIFVKPCNLEIQSLTSVTQELRS